MDRIENSLDRIENSLDQIENYLDHMEDRDLEREIMAQPRAFVRRKDMIGVRAVSSDERYELSARLVEAEESELNLLDVILEGTTHEGEHVYVAVEASVTGDDHDIQRAHTRALLLAKATNSRVLPLVVCVEEPKQQLIELAQQHQVALARKQRGVFLQAPLTSFNPT